MRQLGGTAPQVSTSTGRWAWRLHLAISTADVRQHVSTRRHPQVASQNRRTAADASCPPSVNVVVLPDQLPRAPPLFRRLDAHARLQLLTLGGRSGGCRYARPSSVNVVLRVATTRCKDDALATAPGRQAPTPSLHKPAMLTLEGRIGCSHLRGGAADVDTWGAGTLAHRPWGQRTWPRPRMLTLEGRRADARSMGRATRPSGPRER